MDTVDVILSDVHMHNHILKKCDGLQLTRFKFYVGKPEAGPCNNPQPADLPKSKPCLSFDEDGDLIAPKRLARHSEHDVIGIYHKMSTDISLVGMQVWRSALLMCDYVMHNRDYFKDKHVLELGAGVGLTGIVTGQYASSVICTDVGDEIMNLCQKNIRDNIRTLRFPDSVSTQSLNWLEFQKDSANDFNTSFDVVMACDCIYDNQLTSALLQTLYKLLRTRVVSVRNNIQYQPIALLSLEKRLNFTLLDLDITCHEYNYFKECLFEMKASGKLDFLQIDVGDIPQYFDYDKVRQLELWKIYLKRV